MTTRSTPRVVGAALATAVLIAILSIKLNSFRDYQIAEIAIEVTAVAGLTILTGLSGQISLGNGAFMAIGAYATALLMLHLNWPFILALVIAAAITAVAGAVVYAPTAMNAPLPSEIWPLSPVRIVSPATAVTSIAISAIW